MIAASGAVESGWVAAELADETVGVAEPAGTEELAVEEVIAGEPAAAVGGVVIAVDPR